MMTGTPAFLDHPWGESGVFYGCCVSSYHDRAGFAGGHQTQDLGDLWILLRVWRLKNIRIGREPRMERIGDLTGTLYCPASVIHHTVFSGCKIPECYKPMAD